MGAGFMRCTLSGRLGWGLLDVKQISTTPSQPLVEYPEIHRRGSVVIS